MNSKKLITLLVLTTMVLAMVPLAPVSADLTNPGIVFDNLDNALTNSGEKGNDIEVTSAPGAVASGYEVMVYWDKIQDWNGEKGHLNTSEPDDDGSIEIWFTVPEADVGVHTLWFTATDQETKHREEFIVVSDCDISTSSGLGGSKIYVDLWGLAANKEVAIVFAEEEGTSGAPTTDGNDVVVSTNEVIHTVTATEAGVPTATFSGMQLYYAPVYVAGTDVFTIYHNDGTTLTQIAHNDGTGWTQDNAMFTSAILTASTGLLSVTFTAASEPDVDNTIEVTYSAGHFVVTNENLDEVVVGDEDDYDGTLDHEMVEPGTFVLSIGTDTFDEVKAGEPLNGKLYSAADEKCGSINYVTGEWAIDLGDTAATETGAFSATYEYMDDISNHFYVITTSGLTNDLGTWEDRRITIPDGADPKQYYVVGFDGKNNDAFDDFKIGATISLSTDEGDVGDKIEIEGEGFPFNTKLSAEIYRGTSTPIPCHIIGADDDDDKTDDRGEFEFDIILPDTDKKDDDFKIWVHCTGAEAKASFEITGLTSVNVEPEFGPQGSTITVSGENFMNIKDKKVKISLMDGTAEKAIIETGVKLDSDGSFEADVTVPTENDKLYKIKVEAVADDDGAFNIDESHDFRIGTIMILLSKDEAVVGDKIVLTGNGFTLSGEWNATFGDVTIFEEEQCEDGLLKTSGLTPEFFVPQVEPGVYTITVWDVDAELTVETEFTVTDYTVLEFELLEAPNEFNLSIDGWNWPEVDRVINFEEEIEFVLWNETDDWEMDVRMFGDPTGIVDKSETAYLNKTGFLNEAWWVVPDDEVLDKGIYTVNATIETTNDQEYFMQLEFVIGEVHSDISPRKATFRVGDTVSFNIEHTFGNDQNNVIWGGDVKVYDPDGNLYWDGDPLETWSKVETWYESPYSAQTASENPMNLLDDAPLGTWEYKWRENGAGGRDTIVEGTFNVEASSEDVLGEQIEDLNSAIDDLTGDISDVTDAVASVQSNVNSAIQAANAAVDAANAAVEAVNAVAGTAGEAAEAAQKAAEAASDAKDAAGGLTTLVYGAIGASLVAALAAIVSLMQISRRIAG